jgi:serine/threonine protein kinase
LFHVQIKLIDFGSATISNPAESPPYHDLFFGTAAYASPEILLKKPYQAPPAEIWTLGVLLSYLLTGSSPFATEKDALEGRVALIEHTASIPSDLCLSLLQICLDPDPDERADIEEVRTHAWLIGALERK